MYRSESLFKQAVLRDLKKKGVQCYCIETGGTERGVPDVYCMAVSAGRAAHTDGWIEFKNIKNKKLYPEGWDSLKLDQYKFTIPWRPGQKAFARTYLHCSNSGRSTATVVAFEDGYMFIPMDTVYVPTLWESDVVRENEVWITSKKSLLIETIIDWLKAGCILE